MMEYVSFLISNCIMLGGLWITADILFKEKSKKDILTIIVIILGGMLISLFNMDKLINFFSYVKIFLVFLLMTIFYKNKYRISTSEALISSAIIYGNLVIAEVILTVILFILDFLFNSKIYLIARYSIITGILVTAISIVILRLVNKSFPNLFAKIKKKDSKLAIAMITIFLIIIITLSFIPLRNLRFGMEMILLVLVIIGFIIVALYIFKEEIEKDNRLKEYERLSDYAKANENLLEDYRIRCHESSNHLIIIDHMIPKSNKKAHEYINSLLSDHKINKYYFINELKNIPITELKGFINYKLMIMVNENIHLQINISPEVKSSKLKTLSRKDRTDLYNIVGVLLDNAYDASKESKEKEVAFTMYKEGTTVVLMVANTHKDEIDIHRISEYGYSTKGKNHGTGLYIVDKIIDKNPKFTKETSTFENYFIQTIRIK